MGFLDFDDEPAPALPVAVADVPSDPTQRMRTYETAWSALSEEQRIYLTAAQAHDFRKSKTLQFLGERAPNSSTVYRWSQNNPHFAFVLKVMKNEVVNGFMAKNALAIRHNDIVEQLLEPKDILYQGVPTGFFENQAPAAAKANRDLMELGGHMKPDATITPMVGPALVVQVVAADGAVQIAQVNNGIELHPPVPAFLETDDGET